MEKNAPRVTIGRATSPSSVNMKCTTPGPQNYKITNKAMGDASSVKVVFATAERPISAKPGTLKRI
jgi:hypothetical protein